MLKGSTILHTPQGQIMVVKFDAGMESYLIPKQQALCDGSIIAHFIYRFYIVTVVYAKSIVFMYVSMYFDVFYILWPAGQVTSMKF
jgi:hypothetical protein